jgi:hypothetical protein
MNVNISKREIETLIANHRDLQHDYSNSEDYDDAKFHKERAEELSRIATSKDWTDK